MNESYNDTLSDDEKYNLEISYFDIGQDDENVDNSYCWIWSRADQGLRIKKGGTHGVNFGHEIAGNTFKGWYDPQKKKISVVFPDSELRKLGDKRPTVDDIPTLVYDKLISKFGRRNELVVFESMIKKSQLKSIVKEIVSILKESPVIHKVDKDVFAGDKPLRDLKVDDVQENIVFIRENRKNSFVREGFTLVYFMDSVESAIGISHGKIPYLMIPRGTFYSGGSPITDVWKTKFQRPGTEHILGLVECNTMDDIIYIDMISVRPGYQRNKIATKLLQSIKNKFPNAKIQTSSKTEKGKKFFKASNIDESKLNENFQYLKFWWMDPTSKLHSVSYQHHRDWAEEYLKKLGYSDSVIYNSRIYLIMYRLGFVRVVKQSDGPYTILSYEYEKGNPPNFKKIKELHDLAIEEGCTHFTDDVTRKETELRESLNENMTYQDLLDLTTPERKERAKTARVRSLPISTDGDNERWNFRYKCYPGVTNTPFKGSITFLKGEFEEGDDATKLECKVDCGCQDFRYRFAYNDTEDGASQIGDKSLNKCINRRPQPAYNYGKGLCKHLTALQRYLTTTVSSMGRSNLFESIGEIAKRGPFNIEYYD